MDSNLQRQLSCAHTILTTKLKDWYQKFKKYVPVYILDYWFDKKGEIYRMLNTGTESSFAYDPVTLANGVETLFRILELARKGDEKKAQAVYCRLGEMPVRVEYFRTMIDMLDIYSAVGEMVIKDLDDYAAITTDEYFLETLEARKRNITSRIELERSKQNAFQPK